MRKFVLFVILTTVFLLWVLPVSGDYDISFGFGNIFHENNSAFTQSPGVGENKNFPHYSIKAIYSGKKIYGEEEVLYTNTTGRTLKYIFFVLPASAVTPGAEIKIYSVSVNDQPAEWEAKNTYLVVYLPFYLSPLEKCRVSISFDTIVPESPHRLGKWNGTSMLTCWYPAVPINWDVVVPSSFGDPYSFLAASYDVEISVDPELMVLSGLTKGDCTASYNGRKVYTFSSATPIRDASFVVGRFNIKTYDVGGRNIIYAYKTYDRNMIKHALDSFKTFQKWFGDYPYPSLALVDVPLKSFRGMEYGGVLFFSTLNPPDIFTVVHEMAHQWWYGLVGNDQEEEPWIDEGLANYSALLYIEEKMGKGEYLSRIKSLENRAKGIRVPEELSLSHYSSKEHYHINAYIRGALFWHDVRVKLGDREKVIQLLRGIQDRHRYGHITWDEIKYLLRKENIFF
ncbi:MAG: M1 family metallopeptidase [Clostridia bacterium]|nr:M1 family metallopeptidase [Clostridia bacterium]